MIKIGEVKGYTIFYGANDKLFHLYDAEGQEVDSAPTQQALEDKAGKLCKQAFPLPIPAIKSSSFSPSQRGRVTSVNLDREECWFVRDSKPSPRTKMGLKSGELYEATEANEVIVGQADERYSRIETLRVEIRDLLAQLEKPINLQYFGLRK